MTILRCVNISFIFFTGQRVLYVLSIYFLITSCLPVLSTALIPPHQPVVGIAVIAKCRRHLWVVVQWTTQQFGRPFDGCLMGGCID